MKSVSAAVVGFCALAAICTGAALATVGGGGSIASAPVVTAGVQQNGNTSSFTDSCQNGYEFWALHLTQGDLVKITWGAPAAVDTLALWPGGTSDSDNNGCLYASGWSHWTLSPVLSDTNPTAGTTRLSQTIATTTGTYPLLFLDTTGVPNAGAYSFTAVVLHAASVTLPRLSTFLGAGWLKVSSVVAPDGSLITDSTLKLTLYGYWRDRAGAPLQAHKLSTATPTDGSATFNYSLPPRAWGKKIQLEITGGGGGSDYQPVASQKESTRALIPDGPVLVSPTQLKLESKLLRQPIYWAGPQKRHHYEFTRLTNGNVYVRYLPHGVQAGGSPGKCLIVATYHVAHAYKAIEKYAHGKAVAGPRGSIYVVNPASPKSVYIGFPNVNFEIEVYDPSPKVARAIAAEGLVRPVTS
jgi:hypothetical protein